MLSRPPRITAGKIRSPTAPSCGLMPPITPMTIPASAAVPAASIQATETSAGCVNMPIPKAVAWSFAVARMAVPVRVKRNSSSDQTDDRRDRDEGGIDLARGQEHRAHQDGPAREDGREATVLAAPHDLGEAP